MKSIVRLAALAWAVTSAPSAQFLTDGQVLYASDVTDDELLHVDESSGVVRTVGPIGVTVLSGLAYDQTTGRLYGTDSTNGNLVYLDPATGVTTVVGQMAISVPHGAAIDPADGTLYVSSTTSQRLYRVDKATAATTQIGPGLGAPIGALAVDPTTGILYGGDQGLGFCAGQLYTISKVSGVAAPVGCTVSLTGLACDDAGNLYGASNLGPSDDSKVYLLDKSTAAPTELAVLPQSNILGLTICTGCAEVEPLGCGVNPVGSMTIQAGMPAIGDTLQLAIDNPLATQPPGSAVFLALSGSPAAGYPCGVLWPGFGMAGGGASGELLVDIVSPNPVVFQGPTWKGAGSPAVVWVTVPPIPALIGKRFYVQGLILDATPGAQAVFGLADGAELLIGG